MNKYIKRITKILTFELEKLFVIQKSTSFLFYTLVCQFSETHNKNEENLHNHYSSTKFDYRSIDLVYSYYHEKKRLLTTIFCLLVIPKLKWYHKSGMNFGLLSYLIEIICKIM